MKGTIPLQAHLPLQATEQLAPNPAMSQKRGDTEEIGVNHMNRPFIAWENRSPSDFFRQLVNRLKVRPKMSVDSQCVEPSPKFFRGRRFDTPSTL